jgi:hypothetical protein
VVTTFGPGSMIELPSYSVIVGGVETWAGVSDEVHEPRLVEKLKRLLDLPQLRVFAPPPDNEDPTAPADGHHRLAIPRAVRHPGRRARAEGRASPVADVGPPAGTDQGAVHRRPQVEAPGRPRPVRPGVPEGAHRRPRLARVRAPRPRRLPAAAMGGRAGDERRPGGDRDSVRVQQGAAAGAHGVRTDGFAVRAMVAARCAFSVPRVPRPWMDLLPRRFVPPLFDR